MKKHWWAFALVGAAAFALAYLWIERRKLQTVVQNQGTITKAGNLFDAGESLWKDLRAKF